MIKAQRDLKAQYTGFGEEIKGALLRYENRMRAAAHLKPYPSTTRVFIYTNPDGLVLLLNWKVWMIRYNVSLDFIVNSLLWAFKNQRQADGNSVQLGIPASIVTGPKARKIVEEAVVRAFPYGENYQPKPQVSLPIKSLPYDSPEDLVREYHKAIQERRKRAESPEKIYQRNFRKERKPYVKF